MIILGIDPGPAQTAFARYDAKNKKIIDSEILDNDSMITFLFNKDIADKIVIEMIACYGMPVGASTFDTCVWIGRFKQVVNKHYYNEFIYRRDIKLHLCNSVKAKDANIIQALVDRFDRLHEFGKIGKGTKKNPGPLYGFRGDMWAALAVAVAYAEMQEIEYQRLYD